MSAEDIQQLTAHLFRENSGKMVAVLSKIYGLHQLEAITDIVQDAFETAINKWKYGGLPQNPSAWLMTVAKNKAVNYFKRDSRLDRSETNENVAAQAEPSPVFLDGEIEDSQLRLLLTCCHPTFSMKNQVLLTLSILTGFRRNELANPLMMEEEAINKAVGRTKKHLRENIRILDSTSSLNSAERVAVVHTVLYLMFNEGYKSTGSADLINHDLCFEAIRLAKLLCERKTALVHETEALLAIMFFGLARFPARTSADGKIMTLEKQDRSLWDVRFIKEGDHYLDRSKKAAEISKYHIEAIVSSIHCHASDFKDTDWNQIYYLHEQLEKIEYSELGQLNKLVALSYIKGPSAVISQLEEIKQSGTLRNHYLLYALEGDLLARMNKPALAKRSFKRAYELSKNQVEQEFLNDRILEL